MRQLHSLIASRVSRKAKIEAPLRPQGRVDTSPVDVHSRVRRHFHSFDQKRPNGGHVDIFPPYNIKATDVHNPGGRSSQSRERDMLKLIPPRTLGGALSLSTATCPIWFRPMCAPPESIQRDVECRRSKRVESKGDGQATREV